MAAGEDSVEPIEGLVVEAQVDDGDGAVELLDGVGLSAVP
jgi:hypothetical protein